MKRVKANLIADRPAALGTLVRALAGRGDIDPSYLADGAMNYVSDASRFPAGHYGNTALTEGTDHPRPCRVDIGPDAFRDVSTLYSTVMHEWLHVLQFRRSEKGSEAPDELEARLWEIENLERTGLWRDGQYMGRLAGQLDHWWKRMTAAEQESYEDRYAAAQKTIKRMIGRFEEEQWRQQTGGGRSRRR